MVKISYLTNYFNVTKKCELSVDAASEHDTFAITSVGLRLYWYSLDFRTKKAPKRYLSDSMHWCLVPPKHVTYKGS
jgi:hypothetical protein